MSPRKKTFEQDLDELKDIVEQLDSGELNLDESLKLFEKGIKLYRKCHGTLEATEQKIQMLMEEDGQLEKVTFPSKKED